jgi:hypothetical protein
MPDPETTAPTDPLELGADTDTPVPIRAWEAATAALIAACFMAACIATSSFPLGVHADEPRKVELVVTGANDHFHPLLMLTLARGVCAAFGVHDAEGVVAIGRLLASLSAAVGILACWRLARSVLPAWYALAAALLLALSPIAVLHARYFKEDAFVLPWLTLSILGIAAIQTRSARTLLTGVSVGLACSAKYSALLLVPLLVLSCLAADPARRPRARAAALRIFGVAIATFTAMNLASLRAPAAAARGLSFEVSHMTSSHTVPLPIWTTYGLHYLRESLLPGLGWAVTVLAIAGVALILRGWRTAGPVPRTLVVAVLGWYALHEALPAKPDPGSMRYMLPVAGGIAVLAAYGVRGMAAFTPRPGPVGAACLLLAGLVTGAGFIPALRASGVETRLAAREAIDSLGPAIARERYATLSGADHAFIGLLSEQEWASLPRYVAISSFSFGRFARVPAWAAGRSTLAAQSRYRSLMAMPRLEIAAPAGPLAFHNPRVFIIDFRGNGGDLADLAAALRARYPGLSIGAVAGAR